MPFLNTSEEFYIETIDVFVETPVYFLKKENMQRNILVSHNAYIWMKNGNSFKNNRITDFFVMFEFVVCYTERH